MGFVTFIWTNSRNDNCGGCCRFSAVCKQNGLFSSAGRLTSSVSTVCFFEHNGGFCGDGRLLLLKASRFKYGSFVVVR